MSIPGTAGGLGAEAAGELQRVWRLRMELEAEGQAALAGEGLELSHPRLKAKDRCPSPMSRGLGRRKSKSEEAS